MTTSEPTPRGDLNGILTALIDGLPSEEQLAQLESLLAEDPEALTYYRQYMRICSLLEFERIRTEETEQTQASDILVHAECLAGSVAADRGAIALPTFVTHAYQGVIGYFSQELPFSLLIATVVTCLGLLTGSLIYVTHHTRLADNIDRSTSLIAKSEIQFVGRITNLSDVQWSDISTSTERGNGVPLGRKYGLASGLVEITYDSGAKVILQGPCTYEVDSCDGGYLSVGKLTARVKKKESEIRGQWSEKVASGQSSVASGQWSVASKTNLPSPASGRGAGGEGSRQFQNVAGKDASGSRGQGSEVVNHKSEIINQKSPAPEFAVRTPTAVVTDLGTEFGVAVDKAGATTSHVFRGAIQVQAVSSDGKPEGKTVVLRKDQSARVESRDGSQKVDDRVTLIVSPSERSSFVREMPKLTVKTLDLVDVVAGGDGFSGKRNRGIDPTTGRTSDTHSKEPRLIDDGKYHRVEGMPLIDGVFVPDGRTGEVKVDSAGHTFAGFPANAFETTGFVWAGGVVPLDDPVGHPLLQAMPVKLNGIDYSTPGHGLIFLHANKGITFDLEAIRRANANYRLLRFRAAAGNTEVESRKGASIRADLLVLIDGQSRFQRREIDSSQGAFSIEIPIRDKDRFLTIVATDGGDGIGSDWTIFGDPQLEMVSTKGTTGQQSPKKP